MKNLSISLLSLFVLPLLCHAQPLTNPSPEKAAKQAAAKFLSAPGNLCLSIGIVKGAQTWYYNYGTIEKGKPVKPGANTIFEIGSITKSFTGILLAHAVVEKKIKLNDDIRKYLAGPYPNLAYQGRPIRIIDLATHTAGFAKNIPDIKAGTSINQILELFKDFSEKRFLQELAKVKINVMPGTQYSYSNAGAELTGIILERVYGMSYNDLVQKYIAGPNGMKDTKTTLSQAEIQRFAKGYNEKGEEMPQVLMWRTIPAAGYLKSTVNDLVKYIRLNLDERNPAVWLSHQVVFKNTSEYGNDIGLFWFSKITAKGYRQVSHAGGSFGATSFCLLYPDLKTGIVLITNVAGPETERQIRAAADEILNDSGLVSN